MGFTPFEIYILGLAEQIWKKRYDASEFILGHGLKYGPVSAEGWFTIELMMMLKQDGYDVHKVQRPGDIKVKGRDIIGEEQKIEIRASSVSRYKHIINGWKPEINFLLFGGILNEKAIEKLEAEEGWERKVERVRDNVVVGLLKKNK